MVNIIVLEDEDFLRDEIMFQLETYGHLIHTANSIDSFRKLFQLERPEVAIVDLGLPDGDGINLLREIRDTDLETGLIVVTARSSLKEKVTGFETGADYYLTKPFSFEELNSMILALSRRLLATKTSEGKWILDTVNWTLRYPASMEGSAIRLSAQDLLVLRVLMQNCGHPVNRRHIVATLGRNYLEYDQRRMDTQIRRLRRKTQEKSKHDLPIKTIHGVGYIFAAEAEVI